VKQSPSGIYNRALSEAEIRRIGLVSFKRPSPKTF